MGEEMRSFFAIVAICGFIAESSVFFVTKAKADPCGGCPPKRPYCIAGCGGPHCEPYGIEKLVPEKGACGDFEVHINKQTYSVKRLPDQLQAK
jgi:hypothetical protein